MLTHFKDYAIEIVKTMQGYYKIMLHDDHTINIEKLHLEDLDMVRNLVTALNKVLEENAE